MAIKIGDAVLRVSVDKSGFDQGFQQLKTKTNDLTSTFNTLRRATMPIGIALTSIGAAGLAFADDVKKANKTLGEFMEALKPVFTVMTAFGGLLLTIPPIIRGIVTAINVLKIALIALKAAAFATQAAFAGLTLGISMIATGIAMLVTHTHHVKEITQDTERWANALQSVNDRLKTLTANGQEASAEAEVLRKVFQQLADVYETFDTVGKDNAVNTFNLVSAINKLSDAEQALSSFQEVLNNDIAAGRQQTELGREQIELRRTLIGDTATDIAELITNIEEQIKAEDDLTEAYAVGNDIVRQLIEAEIERRQVLSVTDFYDTAIANLQKYYGVGEEEEKSLLELYSDEVTARREALNDELDAVRRNTNLTIAQYQREYDEKVKLLNDETDAKVKALQDQLDAIDKVQDADDRAREDKENADKITELRANLAAQWTRQGKVTAQKALDDELARQAAELADRERQELRDSLQDQIDDIEDAAAERERQYKEELDNKTSLENDKLDAAETAIDAELASLEHAVDIKRGILQQEYNDAVEIQNKIRDNALANINTVVQAQLNAISGITTPSSIKYQNDPTSGAFAAMLDQYTAGLISEEDWLNYTRQLTIAAGNVPEYAKGGIISEPTLLYGLRSKRPVGIAGEAGEEVISPVGAGSGDVIISGNNFYVREEADIVKIANELHRRRMLKGNFGVG